MFEALSGRPAFSAPTTSETLARILERDPDWRALPDPTPPPIEALLRRTLRKDRFDRLQHIGDARIEIAEVRGALPGQPITRSAAAGGKGVSVRAAMLMVLATAVAVWGLMRRFEPAEPPSQPPVRLVIDLPEGASLALSGAPTTGFPQPTLAISPDGRRVVFVAEQGGVSRIHVRSMDAFESTPLLGTEGGFAPFFSPDGESLGFFTEGKLMKIAVAGGAPVTLCDARNPYGANWGEDGTIVFAENEGSTLTRIPSEGGTPELIVRGSGLNWPQILLGGKAVLVSPPAVVSLDDGKYKAVAPDGSGARYTASGTSSTRWRVRCWRSFSTWSSGRLEEHQ